MLKPLACILTLLLTSMGACQKSSHSRSYEYLLPIITSQQFVNSCSVGTLCHDYYGAGTSQANCGAGFSTVRCSCANAVATCVLTGHYENIIYYSPTYSSAGVQTSCIAPNVFSNSCLP